MLPSRGVVRFGVFELDRAADELRKRGAVTHLRGQPLKVLRLLVDRPGEVITRDELRHALWDDSTFVEFDVGLNAAVRRLRRALGDSADVPRFVETLPGRGYRFLGHVEVTRAAAGAADARPTPTAPVPGPAGPDPITPAAVTRRAGPRAALAGAILVIVAVAAWRLGVVRPATDPAAPIRSVAILPFQNLSSDQEWGFFAAGLADALLTELGRIHELKVISRTSTLRYAGTTQPIPEIARELGVDAVVEGSVLSTRDRVRVTVQLIDGRTDHHRWANSYERPVDDVIALQHDLVNAIVREMGVAVTPEEARQLASRPQITPPAYQAYLRGRYFWQQRTEDGLQKAIPFFEEAIRLSPNYAAAHAGLADVHGLLPRYGTVNPRTALAESKRHALRALELDAGVAEAHTALAKALYTLDWNWADSGAHFARAIDLNPSYATAHHWHSLYLMIVGRIEEALTAALRARDVDPVAAAVHAHAAWVRYLAGDAATAAREAQLGIEMAPRHVGNHELLAWIARAEGRFDASIASFKTAIDIAGDDARPPAALAAAYAAAGRREEATAILEDLERRSTREAVPTEVFVRIHTALGNRDQAFRWLERSAADRSISYYLFDLRYEPLYEPLRRDPRLAELFRSIGLDLNGGVLTRS
jgi:TolB-like protein/DNA-binding winged helix-turn-helix (wHTH) protein/tetratricopeptide (TPR) repeat protein